MNRNGFSTRAIHAGHSTESWQGAVNVPIFASSTFSVSDLSAPTKGHLYGRFSNPTRTSLEECFASLEHAKYALAYPSGMSVLASVIDTLTKPGDHVICSSDCYGGTNAYLKILLESRNVSYSLVDTSNVSELLDAIEPTTKVILFESVTNPTIKIADIEAICTSVKSYTKSSAHAQEIYVVVDNTFMTPYFLNPLDLGVDIVVHSVTKYMNGHSDVIMGAVMLNDDQIYQKLKFNHFHCGTTPSPFDCFLVNRGLKTLALRMKTHSENAFKISQFLELHPAVERVIYPGLKSHPQHNLAKKLSPKGFPGMVSVQLKMSQLSGHDEQNFQLVQTFVSSLKIFTLAVSLGAVESLVDVPVLMTQGCNGVAKEELAKRGINIGLIRLSIGIEDANDLVEDLRQSLDKFWESCQSINKSSKIVSSKSEEEETGEVIEMLRQNLSRTKLGSKLADSDSSSNLSSSSSSNDLYSSEFCHLCNQANCNSINGSTRLVST